MTTVTICRITFFLVLNVFIYPALFGQSYVSQTAPNSGKAKLFFYDRSYNSEDEKNWKIATLPASSNGSGDKVQIELFGGTSSSSSIFSQLIDMGNRNGFSAFLRRTYGNLHGTIRIRAYRDTSGKVDVYFTLLAGNWKGGSVSVRDGSAINNSPLVIYDTPINVGPSPAGTLVFDSFTAVPSLRIDNNAQVFIDQGLAIGMNSLPAGYRLGVDGKVMAEELNVEVVNPPDYVFNNEYKLLTLEDVELFIEENGHLPEVPDASEMSQQGVDIGEMNMLLLKKIEELTLHLIRQEKALDSFKEQLEELKSRME